MTNIKVRLGICRQRRDGWGRSVRCFVQVRLHGIGSRFGRTTPGAAGKTGTALAQSRDTALAADVCGQRDGTRPSVEPVPAVGTALSGSAHPKPGHSLCRLRGEHGRKLCLPKGFFQPPSRKPRHSGLDHRRGYSQARIWISVKTRY